MFATVLTCIALAGWVWDGGAPVANVVTLGPPATVMAEPLHECFYLSLMFPIVLLVTVLVVIVFAWMILRRLISECLVCGISRKKHAAFVIHGLRARPFRTTS